MKKNKRLILIDGHALAFRQYYALERTGMRTSNGMPTWAVYGFFKAIFDLMKNSDLEPDALVVTFDVSHETFRTEKYGEYKANRQKMPDDMQIQMDLIYEGLLAFNIPIYKKEGFEADDVIGTISQKACELGHKVFILTGDQDAFQLIDKNGCIKVIIPSKGELVEYGWNEVYNKLGVFPNQVIDYKALRGDSSDNIPGISGIGEKTAQKLLTNYSDLDNVYENLDNINEKALNEKLKKGKEIAYLSRYLATIVRDVDIDFDFNRACINPPDLATISGFFTKMQFTTFIKNLKSIYVNFNKSDNLCQEDSFNDEILNLEKEQKSVSSLHDFIIEKEMLSDDDFKFLVDKINAQKSFFFLTDALSDNILRQMMNYTLIAVGNIKIEDGKIISLNVDAQNPIYSYYLNNKYLQKLKDFFEDETIFKLTVDSKREYNTLKSNGINLNNVIFDATLASYLDNPAGSHELDIQALNCLNISPINEVTDNLQPVQLGLLDNANNLDKAFRKIWLLIELTKYRIDNLSPENWNLLHNIEIPVAKVLAEMEYTGVAVDQNRLKDLTYAFDDKIFKEREKIIEIAGENFNLNSPKQVSAILFDKLGLKHKKKSKGKSNYSTNAQILEELAQEYDIAKHLLTYRKLSKLKSTYTDAFPKLINPIDKRIHTTYNQSLTVTGRLSSSNPNLQNIPIRTEEGEKIRSAFVAFDPYNCLISADYSQIELRLLAHISKDKNLQNAFLSSEDVHIITASKIFNVPIKEVTKQMRIKAKSVNFGIVYGQTRFGLAKATGISNEEAADFINRYFETYPDVKAYVDAMVENVTSSCFAETIFGRKRYFNEEMSNSNAMIREFAKRAAINFPMQGSAADLMKMAMIRFNDMLKKNSLKSRLILQVHDEIVVEAPKNEVAEVKTLLKEAMELNQPLSVPLVVNFKEGKTWS